MVLSFSLSPALSLSVSASPYVSLIISSTIPERAPTEMEMS